jgi:hypothetical protein
MKKLFGTCSMLAAGLLAFLAAPRAHAQLVTFETLSKYNGQGIIGFTGGSTALSQTFSNVLELQSVTYRFTTTGTDNVSQSVSAYLVQWNPATGQNLPMTTFTAPTTAGDATSDATATEPLTPLQTFTIPPAGTGAWQTDTFSSGGTYSGYDVTITPNQYTDPALTYAIVLINTTNASGLGLLNVNTNPNTQGDAFPYGSNFVNANNGDSTLAAMQSDPGANLAAGRPTADYGFSQIVVVPNGNVVPVPEPRTAAAILCALFVAALVGRQLLLRRQEDAATGAILAA